MIDGIGSVAEFWIMVVAFYITSHGSIWFLITFLPDRLIFDTSFHLLLIFHFANYVLLFVLGFAGDGVLIQDLHKNAKPVAMHQKEAGEHVTKEWDHEWRADVDVVPPAFQDQLREHDNPSIEPSYAYEDEDGRRCGLTLRLRQHLDNAPRYVRQVMQEGDNRPRLPEIEQVAATE